MHPYRSYRLVPSPASNNLCRLALVLEIGPLTETILHAQRKERFVFDARGGRVTCANGNVKYGYVKFPD